MDGFARPLSRATLSASAAVLLVSILAAPAAAQQDTTFDELAVQVEIARGPGELMLALTRDSAVYLPLRPLLDLAAVRIDTVVPGVRFLGRLGAPPVVFEVDGERDEARRGEERWPLAGQAVWRGEELYVATVLIARLLDVDVTVYWADLLVALTRAEGLPAIQRLRRERQRQIVLGRVSAEQRPAALPSRTPLADGMVLDWAASLASRDPERNNSVQLSLGAAVVGGSLTLQRTSTRTPSSRASETTWQWQRAWPEGRLVRQLRLGETGAGGPRSIGVRGGAVTNAPFLRSAEFGDLGLRGAVPPGWEVELYRGEEFLALAPVDSEGRYAVDVPVNYGPNPVDVVAYGPRGEIIRRRRTFAVPFERLPARRIEYGVGGGACLGPQCEAAFNFDLRAGLSHRVSVEVGYDRFWRDSLPDLDHPYTLVAVAPHRILGFQVEGIANALARTRLDIDPSPDFHLDATHTRFDTDLPQPIVGSDRVRHRSDANLFLRPGLGGYTYLQASAGHAVGVAATRTLGRLTATTRGLGARLVAGVFVERDQPAGVEAARRSGLDLGADGVLLWGPPFLRYSLIRVTAQTECPNTSFICGGRFQRGSLSVGRSIAGALRLDLTARADRAIPGITVEISLTLTRAFMRATSRNSHTRAGGWTGAQLFEGSLLWDPAERYVAAASGRQLGRGGVSGIVFLDQNANGRRDPGEPGLPEVQLRVGPGSVVTDSGGRFAVWDLVPFEDAIIEVDSLALPNPLWVAAVPLARVGAGPNSFRPVEIPIQEGAEVTGRVEFDGRPVGGARVLFRHRASGRTRDVTTFSDGTFYLLGVVAGEYEVTPAPGLLSQLRARADPLRVELGGFGRQRVEGLLIRLRRE